MTWGLTARVLLAGCMLVLACGGGWTADLPAGLSFIGLKDRAWRLYVVGPSGAVHEVATAQEPRAASVSLAAARAVYVSAEGDLRALSFTGGDERVLLARSKEFAIAQPAFAPGGAEVYAVEMKEGASAETDIVLLRSTGAGAPRRIVSQPGAQFEPTPARAGRYLLYSSVSCVLGCGRILQEIWRKDLLGGEAIQLTLLNAIARQPVASPDGTAVYFSSDRAGNYHIWRMGWDRGQPVALSSGAVTDSNPVVDRDGNVYFIRHVAAGVRFMRLDGSGHATELPLPGGVEDMRDLEIAQ
jgi:Tol biopolymer transport system component